MHIGCLHLRGGSSIRSGSGNEWLFVRKEGEELTFQDVMSEWAPKKEHTFFACLRSVGLFCDREGNVKTRNLWTFVSLVKIS